MDCHNGMAALHGIKQAYADWCKPLCQELGMPLMAIDILMFLSENPDLCTARDINRCHGFKENILSVNVNKLVGEGYLCRLSVEGDRRKVRLVLTEKARPVIKRVRRAQEEFDRLIKEGITPEELAVFAKCLEAAGENARRIQTTYCDQELHDEEHI